jgi:lipopolysaccharide export system protein LptC
LKRALILVGAVVLTAAVLFRWWLPTERIITPSVAPPDTRLDYRLQDFEARFFDAQGRPELRVQGPSLEHDAETRVVTLLDPEFQISTATAPWNGRANLGRFEREFDTLELIDEVELWRDGPKGRLTLTTQALQHQRPARTISADVPVDLTQPGTELSAGGLMIQLDTDIVDLSNDLHITSRTARPKN